jgi:uncharacterized alkaline shock family protein YloU
MGGRRGDEERGEGRPVEPEEARAHGNDPDAVRIRREEEGAERRSGGSVSATGGRSDDVGGSPAREGEEGSSRRREGEEGGRGAAGEQRQDQQGRGQEREQRGTRQAERHHTTIGEAAVRKIAGVAAQEVEKVQMGGGTATAVSGFLGSVTGAVTGGGSGGGGSLTAGVSAEVGEEEAAFDLTMAVEYGVQIPRTTEAVRQNVINRVENLTGLRVTEVNITVNDVQFPEERQAQEQERRAQG